MQEVCSSMDPQLGGIKSELSPLITGHHPQQQQQPRLALLGASSPNSMKMSINCDKRETSAYWMGGGVNPVGGTESGFINSQPSMSEFLTQIDPESPKMGSQVFPMVSPSDSGGGMDVPEYPWMKEKKTARKNSATQGERFGSCGKGFVTGWITIVPLISSEGLANSVVVISDPKLFVVHQRRRLRGTRTKND